MARQREFDEDKVLNALRDVFWRNGYDGASYAEIMKATGLQKGSLYAAYGDKRSLYLKAIERYDMGTVSDGVRMLSDETLHGRVRIANLFDSLVDAAETQKGRWGCLLCNAAADQAPFNAPTESAVANSMNRLKSAIKKALKDTNSPDITELVWSSYFGGHTLVKSGASKAVLRKLKAQITKSV